MTKTEQKKAHKRQLDAFYAFLGKTYDVAYFPKPFFVKIASLENGSFARVTRPVPVTDLLDMWEQKLPYLNRVAAANKAKGKPVTGMDRVNYDLAILLSRYDAYLAWKQKQAEEAKKAAEQMGGDQVDYTRVAPAVLPQKDLSDILDEI